MQLDEAYPGGLLQYVGNAKRLLQDSREGGGATCSAGQPNARSILPRSAPNPVGIRNAERNVGSRSIRKRQLASAGKNAFDGYEPSVPEGAKLDYGSQACNELETLGEAMLPIRPHSILLSLTGTSPRSSHVESQW